MDGSGGFSRCKDRIIGIVFLGAPALFLELDVRGLHPFGGDVLTIELDLHRQFVEAQFVRRLANQLRDIASYARRAPPVSLFVVPPPRADLLNELVHCSASLIFRGRVGRRRAQGRLGFA